MIKKSIFYLIVVSFILLLVANRCDKNNTQEIKLSKKRKTYLDERIIGLSNIKRQNIRTRKFIHTPKIIKKIKLEHIYRPYISELHDKYFFLIDYSSMIIHKIALNGNKKLSFGKGKGRGPGELINPMDIEINDEKILIADAKKSTIEVYTMDGKYIKTIKLENCIPYRFIIDKSKNEYIVNKDNSIIFNFYRYDLNGNLIKKFGAPLVNKKLKSRLYHESQICKISDSTFVQIPMRLGIIGFYKNDTLQYIKETVDGIQDPNYIVMKNGYENINRNNYLYTCQLVSSNKSMIVMERLKSKDGKKERCFDIYDKNSLDYLFSFKLPVKNISISLTDQFIVTHNYNNIVIMELPKLNKMNK